MVRRITIDAAGRIIIPKRIRERLRLTPGSHLLLREEADRLVLDPVPGDDAARDLGELVVFDGELVGPIADHRTVRDERLDRLGGTRR